METRGLLKRIAAITMAALTIVTSSGVDVNLLTAKAGELTEQATDNKVDENVNDTSSGEMQKKEAKVGAQAKLSFSTDDELKSAVEDAVFTVDVKTRKVTAGQIKVGKTLLALDTDYTATAKQTATKKINSKKYRYTYTVTVKGIGDYTGTATKKGVEQLSNIVPKKAKKSNSPKKDNATSSAENEIASVEAETTDASGNLINNQKMGGWQISFDDTYHTNVPVTDGDGKKYYRISYFDHNHGERFTDPSITATYVVKDKDGKELSTYKMTKERIEGENIVPEQNGTGYGKNTGIIKIRTTPDFQNDVKADVGTNGILDYIKGIDITYDTYQSVIQDGTYTIKLRETNGTEHDVTFDTRRGRAMKTFPYTGGNVEPQVWISTNTSSGTARRIGGGDNKDGTVGQITYSSNSKNAEVGSDCYLTVEMPKDLNYEKITINYSVGARDLTADMVGQPAELTYNGQDQTPTVTVKSGNTTLTPSSNYEDGVGTDGDYYIDKNGVNSVDAGTYTLNVIGRGHYAGSVPVKYTIAPKQAVDSNGNLANGMTLTGLDTAAYAGGEKVEPKPTITYTPTGSDALTLTEGKDYTVSYGNNDGKIGSTGTATVNFINNYSGSITKTFTISKGNLESVGTVVYLGTTKIGTITSGSGKDGKITIGTDADVSTVFDPIESEKPDFRLGIGGASAQNAVRNGTGISISVEPVTDKSKNTHTWPEASNNASGKSKGWKWTAKLQGDGVSYTGTVYVEFSVNPLSLSETDDSPINATASLDADGNATAKVTYKSLINADKNPVEISQNDNYDIAVTGDDTAGSRKTITITGKGNYTGKRELSASKGYDISNKANLGKYVSKAPNILVQLYDPYTGENITGSSEGLTYYGENVTPKFVLAVKTGTTTKDNANPVYKQLEEGVDYEVSEPVDSSAGYKKVTITAKNGSSYIYGTIDADEYTRYRIAPLNLNRAYKSDSSGKTTEDGDIKVTVNTDSLDTYKDLAKMQDEIKIYVKPKTAGQTIYVSKQSGSNVWNKPETSKPSDGTDYISWQAPNVWTGSSLDGTLLKPGDNSDYTLANLASQKVDAIGRGIHYSGTYHIDLNKVNITNSSDYEISPFTAENAYNGDPVFPEVGLKQISTNTQVDPESYYIIYKDKDGHSYVFSTYITKDNNNVVTKSEKTDRFTITYNNQSGSSNTTVTNVTTTGPSTSAISNDTTQVNPLDGKTTNKASYFSDEGTYTVTIRMKGQDDDHNSENTTGLTGEITKSYTVKSMDENPNIKASFSPSEVDYDGFETSGTDNKTVTAKTPKPILTSADSTTDSDPDRPKLTVNDKSGKKVVDAKYYTLDRTSDDKYFTYPGKKTVTITASGDYAGISTVSYMVKGNLGDLNDKNKYTVSGIKLPDNKNERLIVYTDGDNGFKYEDGTVLSLDSIRISIPNTSVRLNADEKDFTVTPSKITSTGNVDITIDGADGSPYDGTSYTIYLKVIESRSGLKWTKNGTDELELPYRSNGYTLGNGDLSIKSPFSTNNVTLEKQDKDHKTGDAVSITGEYGAYDPRTGSSDTETPTPTLTEPGKYIINIEGPTGTGQSSELILYIKYDLSQTEVQFGWDREYTYDGTDPYKQDQVTVTLNGQTLEREETSGDGTTTTYENYTLNAGTTSADVGTYTVEIGETNRSKYFSDSRPDTTYSIRAIDLDNNLKAESLGTIGTYNGKELTVDDSVFNNKVYYEKSDGTKAYLRKGEDYDVTFVGGLTNAGTRNYLVSAKGNYAGSANMGTFTIAPFNLSTAKVKAEDQYYQGGAEVTPEYVTINGIDGKVQVDDVQFKSEYSENTKSGVTVTMTMTGLYKEDQTSGSNFTGTATTTYVINQLDIAKATLIGDTNYATFGDNGGDYLNPDRYIQLYIPRGNNAQYKLLYSNTSGTKPADYTFSFKRETDGNGTAVTEGPTDRPLHAGSYTVTLTALPGGRLLGGSVKTFTWKVNQEDISNMDSQFRVDDAEWTGSEVTPTVRKGDQIINNDSENFSVRPTANAIKACGTLEEMRAFDDTFVATELPQVTISGTGDYTGALKKTFRIGHPFESYTTYTVNGGTIRYDGQNHVPTYTLNSANSKINIADVQYTPQNPSEAVNAGQYSIILTATDGPLYGTKEIKFTIWPASGNTWGVELPGLQMDSSGMYSVQYQGAEIRPEVSVYTLGANNVKTPMAASNYTVTYANNNAAGTASVTVKPTNYEGSKTVYFKILGVDLSDNNGIFAAFTDGITRRKYTGSAITPKITVTYSGTQGAVTLTQDRDFAITYTDNTNAGAANAKITGIGNYTGSKDLPFTIYADLNDKTSTFTIPKQMYTGQPITELSGATIKAGGNDLKLGTDYSLSITSTDSFRTKGTAIFTAQGKYYEGTRTVQFDIGNDASMYNVLGVAATYVYDRQAHKPVPVVTDKQGTVYPTDSVVYSSTSDGDACINAGNVRMQITITSHGQTVTIPYNYAIQARDINTTSITPLADVDYNGKAHTPDIRITDGTNLLTGSPTSNDGTADFTYTYYNNTQPGMATVTITGINNYTGVANIYFAINVKTAPQMIVTAMPSGRLKVTWKKVSGVDGYRIFYAPENGSQKQVNLSSSKKSTYLTGLTRGVLYTVGIQSYITANGQNGYSTASVQQIATSTTQPKITSAKSTGKGKIKLTWNKVNNATGYMVYRKTTGSKKWTRVKTTKSTSFTNTGLKSGRKYTYKVISYRQSGVKRSFSKYSAGKTVKAK